ncbi:hypothetical protein CCACVL1_06196 [Corchorus capsularis]|uniref:Uncharacterized protein n=1 Tax=Corchorus capsularis TaxID=210143 RepID=A0A1R3JGW4_COCAP|nr:hypothetical protein CCACVL1_06196 [Corchorus capsularis]
MMLTPPSAEDSLFEKSDEVHGCGERRGNLAGI